MTTPISQKRLAANRANAVRSTGPRSEDGKARSAKNSLKHGFTAASFAVLRMEDVRELETLRAEAIHVYRPVNSEELFAVERIALSKLSILRAARLEGGMFTDILGMSLNDSNVHPFVSLPSALEADPKFHGEQVRAYALANGLNRMMRGPNAFALFLRYQTLAERQYRRAVEEFDRLKRLRDELPNEPIEDPEPEQINPDTPIEDEATDPAFNPYRPDCDQPEFPPDDDYDDDPGADLPLRPDPAQAPDPDASTDYPSRRNLPALHRLVPVSRCSPRPPAPDKIGLSLPKNIHHEIWRHRLSRQQLRSRRVLRRHQQSRAEGGVHLA